MTGRRSTHRAPDGLDDARADHWNVICTASDSWNPKASAGSRNQPWKFSVTPAACVNSAPDSVVGTADAVARPGEDGRLDSDDMLDFNLT